MPGLADLALGTELSTNGLNAGDANGGREQSVPVPIPVSRNSIAGAQRTRVRNRPGVGRLPRRISRRSNTRLT